MADTLTLPAAGAVVATDDVSGTHYQRVKLVDGTLDSTAAIGGDATNGLDVDVTRIAAGTNYVGKVRLTDGSNDTTVSATGSLYVGGSIAHDGTDSGNPIKIGAKALSADGAAVSTGDRTDLMATLTGKLVTSPYTIPEYLISGTASTTGSTDTAVIAAITNFKIYVTTIIAYNSSATNTYINVKDGSTTKLVIPLPAYGGATITLPVPLACTVSTALNFACPGAVTTAYCSAVGFKGV